MPSKIKLDPSNSSHEKVVVGGGIATTILGGAKHAPQAGYNNTEVLPTAVGKKLTAGKTNEE